jgi:SAM-dependent methyltransferase
MSTASSSEGAPPANAAQQPPVPGYLDARATFASHYLFGEGIEIGPLHLPLAIPVHAHARYVDRMTVEDLRREYPELADWNLNKVDIVDNGERLETVAAESQDFIIANHFLEHTENPIGTIQTHLGKLKPGGVLFYAVPDKRFTFDYRRPVTQIDHMAADYEEGPQRSRREHYEEWTRLVPGQLPPDTSDEQAISRARELDEDDYSIHMHVWTQAEFLALILDVHARTNGSFDIEAAARQGIEFIVVLRKAGPLPSPEPPVAPQATALRRRARRALRAAKQELLGPRR